MMKLLFPCDRVFAREIERHAASFFRDDFEQRQIQGAACASIQTSARPEATNAWRPDIPPQLRTVQNSEIQSRKSALNG